MIRKTTINQLAVNTMQEKNYQESISTAFDLINNDQVEQALEIFTDVFTNTEDPLALFGMATCAYNRKDYVAALTQLHELIDADPEFAQAYNLCGQISHQMNDLRSAKSFYMLAIEKDSTLVDAQRNYGDVLLDMEDYDNGVQAYVKILQNHPDDIPTLLRMSRLYMEVNQYQSALLYVGKVLEMDQNQAEALEIFGAMQSHLDGTKSQIGKNP